MKHLLASVVLSLFLVSSSLAENYTKEEVERMVDGNLVCASYFVLNGNNAYADKALENAGELVTDVLEYRNESLYYAYLQIFIEMYHKPREKVNQLKGPCTRIMDDLIAIREEEINRKTQ